MENKKEELRLYFFNQFYMSGIRNGIQAGHAADILQHKYISKPFKELYLHMEGEKADFGKVDFEKAFQIIEWQEKHLTYVVLNGGDCQNMGKLRGLLESPKNPFPFAAFKETGMSNLLTSVCILLPERIFNRNNQDKVCAFRNDPSWSITNCSIEDLKLITSYTDWEKTFIVEMSKCPKAD